MGLNRNKIGSFKVIKKKSSKIPSYNVSIKLPKKEKADALDVKRKAMPTEYNIKLQPQSVAMGRVFHDAGSSITFEGITRRV